VRLGEYLVAAGHLSADSLYEALSFQQGLPVVRVEAEGVPPAVAWLLPEHVVREWRVLPFRVAHRSLYLVSPEAPTPRTAAALARFTTLETHFHLVTPNEFERLASALL
jgi:hypothetical protein